MDRYRNSTNDSYNGRRSGARDEGMRVTVDNNDFYRRGRSPSPRDRFPSGGDQRRRGPSPRREDQYRGRNEDSWGKGDQRWSGGQDRRSRDRSSERLPKRYSPSWRRQSIDRSPRRQRGASPERGRQIFNRSKSRSLSRGRHRSRSRSRNSSRGRGRYKSSPSPRRRSGRSSSYGDRKRFKKTSSSEDEAKPKDDFFKSMYSRADGEDSDNQGYLHPSLNRGIQDAAANKPVRPPPTTMPQERIGAEQAPNAASLAALSQAYGNSPQRKTYQVEEIDDEDRFLYGDDQQVAESKPKRAEISLPKQEIPVAPPPQPAPEPVQKPAGVTPGGFDSNALKNVLKAIGFDFEMSAQQSATKEQKQAPSVPASQAPAVQQPQMQLQKPVEVPQPIQAMHSAPVPQIAAQPGPAPVPMQANQQQYYQPYDPYSQTPQAFQQQLDITSINTSLGYPVSTPNPADPAGAYVVYQPGSSVAQQPTHAVYPATLTSMAYQQPDAQIQEQAITMQRGRVVLLPQREEISPKLSKAEKDRQNRQERLNYLQLELEKLKRQQNELMRKKRKEKDGHKDPLIKKNNLLQAGVQEQIREIQEAAERAAGIMSDSSEDEQEITKSEKEEKYDYFDPGKHWCRLCNTVSADLGEFLSHLHSKSHRKAIDPYDRPWNENEPEKKKKSAECVSKALKGSEFLLPITGYFCTLCQTFSGDQICAEDHCKSYLHNVIYKKHCKKNPSYERKFKKKKKAAVVAMENGKQDAGADKAAKKAKHVEKQEKYVEKEQRFVEKETKQIKIQRYVEREPQYEKAPRHVEKPKKYTDDPYTEKHNQKHLDKEVKYGEREIKKEKKPDIKEQDQGRYARTTGRERDERDKKHGMKHAEKRTFQEEAREEKQPPKKYSGNYERRVSADRGGRRKGRWSPGYDEYERSQQDTRHQTPEKKENESKRSHSRDRSERWVERDIKEEQSKKSEDMPRGNQQSIGAGGKVPTPGFGKFSWNSNATSHIGNSAFDQVPVDNEVFHDARDDRNEDRSGKGKIAIKITGKTHVYPPRIASTQSIMTRSHAMSSSKSLQDRKAATAIELQKKVEALKKENALRAHLSSITLPAGRNAKQFQPGPNTAAVILGSRGVGKATRQKLQTPMTIRPSGPRPSTLGSMPTFTKRPEARNFDENVIAKSAGPVPAMVMVPKEPPPPGEEDIGVDEGDGANSDASGISMEIASDEE